MKRTVVSNRRPWRSTQMSHGPLTMISVTRVVCEQPLERPVPDDVVGRSASIRSRSSRESPGSGTEPGADVGADPLAERHRVDRGVEELRAQIGDHGQVDPVLQVGKGVARRLAAERGWWPTVARGVPSYLPRSRRRRPWVLPRPRRWRTCRRASRNALAASDRGFVTTIGVPSLIDRGMSRSLGTDTSGARPDYLRPRRRR